MKEIIGDIWTFHKEGHWIVITTNIGWKSDGTNPMGAGIAKVASELYPGLSGWYGLKCQKFRERTPTCYYQPGKLFLFPTKAFNESQPWMSWKQDSSVELITKSTKQLSALVDILGDKVFGDIGIPLVGCMNGKLRRRDVINILRDHLSDRFILIEKDHC